MRPRLNEILRQPNLFSSQNSFIYELKIVLISEAYCFGEFVFLQFEGKFISQRPQNFHKNIHRSECILRRNEKIERIHNNTEILSDTSKFSSPKHLLTNWEERNFYKSLNTFEYRGSNQNKPNADQNTYSSKYNTQSSLHEFQKLSNNIENLKNEAFLYLIITLTAINLC